MENNMENNTSEQLETWKKAGFSDYKKAREVGFSPMQAILAATVVMVVRIFDDHEEQVVYVGWSQRGLDWDLEKINWWNRGEECYMRTQGARSAMMELGDTI